MRKQTLERLLKRFQDLRKLVDHTIKDIEEALQDEDEWVAKKGEKRRRMKPNILIDEESLRQEWQQLREEIRNSNDPQSFLSNFVQRKSKLELRAFLQANALPIDPKSSKEEISKQIAQLLKVAQTITGDLSRQV